MASEDQSSQVFDDKEHRAAYIFDPADEADGAVRPAKRRKVSKKHDKVPKEPTQADATLFQPLFETDAEVEATVRLRQTLFQEAWLNLDKRIHYVLREANQSTLKNVTSFVRESPARDDQDKIPSGFIVTGANIASQELLFEQLSETLQDHADAKVVRLRSADASNLKAALKKIIHDVTARATEDGDDLEVAVGKDGRKYLNYDLEALHSHLKVSPRTHIIICFQDSEAFEAGLLSDLILLFSSWLDRIPFALLFGVATSVELFQARLLKSTCHHLYGDKFDVEQSTFVIEKIFKTAVAHVDAPLRLGSSLLQALLQRQQEQVAGLSMFVNSLKYTYMCHYYANPLSVFLAPTLEHDLLSKETFDIVRSLPSFRTFIEHTLSTGDIQTVKSLLDDDKALIERLKVQQHSYNQWTQLLLRNVNILTAFPTTELDFVQIYLDTIANGIDMLDDHKDFIDAVQRASPDESTSFLTRILEIFQDGDNSTGLSGWVEKDNGCVTALSKILVEIRILQETAEEDGIALKSKYSGHNRVLRTTVIAQKVQLSQDTANLTEEDKAYTGLVEGLVDLLKLMLKTDKVEDILFHEVWFYDLKTPYKDVFIPRPRAVVERALSRPHDYLGCSCCSSVEDEMKPTLPATAILYHLYLETGSLINVADLWSAFYAIVGDENNDDGLDERTTLVLFYRAISELKALGFVKQSRKKADHIAKLAWHGL
ncbi:origin recognition complex subunit [Truncatella angustata]|uniref:Origin recognition complex subunit n=1 Tax=Truncatella angustata TaxID=152316 RepID=A0A9P8RI23_9PEZI|nr:origin recognition complex subunit [Truncatella angustata]KAH6646418.1 origin recognition complex subunit [Truncatella angustata]